MMFNVFTYTPASHFIMSLYLDMTSSKSSVSPSTGRYLGPICFLETSSTPPLSAYSRHLARLARAPKNCISLPTRMEDTQQAMA